jgi:hypothetical protein
MAMENAVQGGIHFELTNIDAGGGGAYIYCKNRPKKVLIMKWVKILC